MAILALLYGTGLRVAELVSLRPLDVGPDSVRVIGKGNRERIVPIPKRLQPHLDAWRQDISERPWAVQSMARNRAADRPMTQRGARKMLATRARRAGLAHLSPHDFRRTYVTALLDLGNDLAVVASLAGHANVRTTTRYDRRGDAARRSAADSLTIDGL